MDCRGLLQRGFTYPGRGSSERGETDNQAGAGCCSTLDVRFMLLIGAPFRNARKILSLDYVVFGWTGRIS